MTRKPDPPVAPFPTLRPSDAFTLNAGRSTRIQGISQAMRSADAMRVTPPKAATAMPNGIPARIRSRPFTGW